MIDREIRNIEMLGVSNIGGIRGYLQTQGNGNGIVQQVQAGLSVSKSGITPLSTNFYSSSKFSSDEETSEFIVKYLLSKGDLLIIKVLSR